MKKSFLYFFLLMAPIGAAAQNQLFWYKDFADKVVNIADVKKVNEHLELMTINIDKTNFEVVAIDDKMKVLWRTALQGYGIASGIFKGHVLSIAASRGTEDFGFESPYTAILLDEKTGKVQTQKEILRTKPDGQEIPITWYSNDGNDFEFLISQSNGTKTMSKFPKHFDEIRDLTLVSLNETLDAKVLKPNVPADPCLTTTFNNSGEILMLTFQPASFTVLKYDKGKTEPSAIVQPLDYTKKISLPVLLTGSTNDNNVCFFSIGYRNSDKEMEIVSGKSDFTKNTCQTTKELFDKQHIKSIKKDFVPFDKSIDDLIFGYDFAIIPLYLQEVDGGLLVAITADYLDGHRFNNKSPIIINSYGPELQQRFQQILPIHWLEGIDLEPKFHIKDNMLNIVSATMYHVGAKTIFASLDLKTGSWLKVENLFYDSFDGVKLNGSFWWKDSLVIPYDVHHGIHFVGRSHIELQQFSY